jgi:hypothetical protein
MLACSCQVILQAHFHKFARCVQIFYPKGHGYMNDSSIFPYLTVERVHLVFSCPAVLFLYKQFVVRLSYVSQFIYCFYGPVWLSLNLYSIISVLLSLWNYYYYVIITTTMVCSTSSSPLKRQNTYCFEVYLFPPYVPQHDMVRANKQPC